MMAAVIEIGAAAREVPRYALIAVNSMTHALTRRLSRDALGTAIHIEDMIVQ
jgi:hypothetical protein